MASISDWGSFIKEEVLFDEHGNKRIKLEAESDESGQEQKLIKCEEIIKEEPVCQEPQTFMTDSNIPLHSFNMGHAIFIKESTELLAFNNQNSMKNVKYMEERLSKQQTKKKALECQHCDFTDNLKTEEPTLVESRDPFASSDTENFPSDNEEEPIEAKPTKKRKASDATEDVTESVTVRREDEIEIQQAKKNLETGTRVRDKVHACLYCYKFIRHMSKHFEKKHHQESEVTKLLVMPKKSKMRRSGFVSLMRVGDYHHNCEVITKKEGQLVLVRRPPENFPALSYHDYGPCPDCLGFMLKKHIWHHVRYSCVKSVKIENKGFRRNPISESNALLSHTHTHGQSYEFTANILNRLKTDHITSICKQDCAILKYGAMQYEKYGTAKWELIRQSMRQLGRLVVELRKLTTTTNKTWLADWLVVDEFDTLIWAVIKTSANPWPRQDRVPTLTYKLGYSIKKCAAIWKGIHLIENDVASYEKLQNFCQKMDMEWQIKISSQASTTFSYGEAPHVSETVVASTIDSNDGKFDYAEFTRQLLSLNGHLNDKLVQAKTWMSENVDDSSWAALAAVVLTKFAIFNRRPLETSALTLTQYSSRPNWSDKLAVECGVKLTPFERKMAGALTTIRVKTETEGNVYLLMTDDVKECVDMLNEHRRSTTVHRDNPYVFATCSNTMLYVCGRNCLEAFGLEAGLRQSALITRDDLRNYVATLFQVIGLDRSEMGLLRELLPDVDLGDCDGLRESSNDLAKVTRLLLDLENGRNEVCTGKTLAEIDPFDLTHPEDNILDDQSSCSSSGNVDQVSILNTNRTRLTNPIMNVHNDFPELLFDPPLISCNKNSTVTPKATRKPWSDLETETVLSFFRNEIGNGKVPGKKRCEECLKHSDVLFRRTWKDLKYHVYNQLKKKMD